MHTLPTKIAILSFCIPGLLMSAARGQSTPADQSAISRPNAPAADVANYVLGPEDQITVSIFASTDFPDKPIAIANDGTINLPMIGRVRAAGLTVEQLQAELVTQYKKYFKDPEVMIQVNDYHSQPASVAGEVSLPGVVQLRGNRNLMEVIALAGGVRADAGDTILITRNLSEGPIPVPGAFTDSSGRYSVAHIDMRAVLDGRDPAGNILIKPHDVITVTRAKMVYVLGNVNKPGGFVLTDSESLSVSQALALAGGWDHTASLKNARILRAETGGQRTEVATDVSKIMENKAPDLKLYADDILFVPNSIPKSATLRGLEAAVQAGTGFAVWR